jgi:ankyrin repeat protein
MRQPHTNQLPRYKRSQEISPAMNPLPMEREGTDCNSRPPIMTLPNELIFDVASHLESFKDLNSLLRTTRRFHTLLNTHLYRLAVAADETVREDIVWWVLSKYQVSSLRLLLDKGLSVQLKLLNKFRLYRYGIRVPVDLLRLICDLSDQKRCVPLARLLIERGADIEAHSVFGTVLHKAVSTDNFSITELLLTHGADTNAIDYRGRTPLHWICERHLLRNQVLLAQVLLDHGADSDINAVMNNGRSPLFEAFVWKNWEMCTLLLDRGADTSRWHSSKRKQLLRRVERWQKRGILDR